MANNSVKLDFDKILLALREAEEIFGMLDTGARDTLNKLKLPEDAVAFETGNTFGYGAMMDALARMWRKKLAMDGHHPGGAFVSGPCASTVETVLKQVREALAELDQAGFRIPRRKTCHDRS